MSFFDEEIYILILEIVLRKNSNINIDKITEELAIPKSKILAKINTLLDIGIILKTTNGFYKITDNIIPYHVAKMSELNVSLEKIVGIKVDESISSAAVSLTLEIDKIKEIDNNIRRQKLEKGKAQGLELLESDAISEILEKLIESTDNHLIKSKNKKSILSALKEKTKNVMFEYRKNISKPSGYDEFSDEE